MTKKPQMWFPLDGSWHKSVHTRLSALHLESRDPHTKGSALCNPMATALYEDEGYTEAEAKASGRACRRCLKHSSGDSDGT